MSSAPEVALSEVLKSADVAPPNATNARIVDDDPSDDAIVHRWR